MSDEIETDVVDANFDAFVTALPRILPEHHGEFALLHDLGIVAFFENALTATMEGAVRFGRGQYSVQEVTAGADSLGFYSYVGVSGTT